MAEARMMQNMNHPNIVKFRHVSYSRAIQYKTIIQMYKCDRKLFLGMEYVRAGRLENIIKERFDKGQKFSDLEASELIKGIL